MEFTRKVGHLAAHASQVNISGYKNGMISNLYLLVFIALRLLFQSFSHSTWLRSVGTQYTGLPGQDVYKVQSYRCPAAIWMHETQLIISNPKGRFCLSKVREQREPAELQARCPHAIDTIV